MKVINKAVLILMIFFSINIHAITEEELISNSVSDRMNLMSLEKSRDFYKSISLQDQKLLIKLMYREFRNRQNKSSEELMEFANILSSVADEASKNMIAGMNFELELPNFKYDNKSNIVTVGDFLRLHPSKKYLLDFKNNIISDTKIFPKGEYLSENNYVNIAYDSMRGITILIFPTLNSSEVIDGHSVSYEELYNRIKNTNPNFNIGRIYK
jgi:hypothetical protein